MTEMGRMLMILGVGIFLLGLIVVVAGRIPGLGQLPGDIQFQRGNFRLYAPCATMIVLSVVLTVLLNIIVRLMR